MQVPNSGSTLSVPRLLCLAEPILVRADLLEGLGFLANLAGNDAVSYDTIKERVIPVLVEEAKDELRRKLAGNSYQGYFASLIGFDSSAY
ncbi:MAG: hypothetical protein V3U49_06150 [Nitrososphaerales archaeon]